MCVSALQERAATSPRNSAAWRNVLMNGPGSGLLLAASAGRAASVALEACAVSHQGEVSALLAGLTFIAFDASFADQLGFASFSQRFHGAGDRLRESRRCDRLGRSRLRLHDIADACCTGRRHAGATRELQLVLLRSPLSHEAAGGAALAFDLCRGRHLAGLARPDLGMAVLARFHDGPLLHAVPAL